MLFRDDHSLESVVGVSVKHRIGYPKSLQLSGETTFPPVWSAGPIGETAQETDVQITVLYYMGMEFSRQNIYANYDKIVHDGTIDISSATFMTPWGLCFLCLSAVERHTLPQKAIILPTSPDVRSYLKRMHFNETLRELEYYPEAKELDSIEVPERQNNDLQELRHCRYIDQFSGRLGHFQEIFERFGLTEDEARRATNVVAELGNNVFDHNLGNWPTEIGGAFIAAQRYPNLKVIDTVVADPGVGFLGSLKSAYPELQDDVAAIRLALSGKTGRIGEDRGNGLHFVQTWTIKDFGGNLSIHSNSGTVIVDKEGIKSQPAPRILGTIAQFEIYYKG